MTPEPKAVFIDRDGTLNIEKNYVYRPSDFEFIPGSVTAVRRLNEAGYTVIVVSNQSGVARGLYTEDDVKKLHRFISKRLEEQKAHIDAFFYCPHHPAGSVREYAVECSCRKPKPGMILEAKQILGIQLESSYMIGDSRSDIELALNTSMQPLLVRTGHGLETEEELPRLGLDCPVYDDLHSAVDYILNQGT